MTYGWNRLASHLTKCILKSPLLPGRTPAFQVTAQRAGVAMQDVDQFVLLETSVEVPEKSFQGCVMSYKF